MKLALQPIRKLGFCSCLLLLLPIPSLAQDRLKTMPGYERYAKMRAEISGAYRSGALSVTWQDGGKAFEYRKDGKRFRYDLATRKATEIVATAATEGVRADRSRQTDAAQSSAQATSRGPFFQERGRQLTTATSPDGKKVAAFRDYNLWVRDADGKNEVAVTTDGSATARIKYGTASWVYGEELNQNTAMWWSPDSRKLAYYRFDETKVPDYYLGLDQTKLQSRVDTEPYPKAGVPNPIVDMYVFDVASRRSVRIDVRDGEPFADDVIGHYVYRVSWSADSRELLFHRTNRRQNDLEFAAADVETGECRVILRETWWPSWTENAPPLRYLRDRKRFIWASERTGFLNFYLYDLAGELLATLTSHPFEVGNIVRVDEDAGLLYYMARSGDNHMKLQLHRVKLDGTGDVRLTDPAYQHSVDLAPDGRHFIDTCQTHDSPPSSRLVDEKGNVIEELSRTDMTKFDQLGLKRVELFTFAAADGETELYGLLHKPSNFDPQKKYPLLVSVYAGPSTSGARETFTLPNATTELGFLYATLDSRSSGGRGKQFLDAIYQRLGVVEIDDQAGGVKALAQRLYVDGTRVGIYGTSYGGYASAMCLLRYPDIFQAACAASPVTDWRHYDTIYTERYMWTPQENKAGYDAGSAMTYADRLKGRLMLYYGTADNNVHPSNSMQLIAALQRAGKSFEVQIGPDRGHSGINQDRMLEFFIENLRGQSEIGGRQR